MEYYIFTLIFLIFFIISVIREYTIGRYKKITRDEKSLVASVSHDLKTPASAQYNMLNMLLKGQFGELTPSQYEMVKLTCCSTAYMKNLLTTIMTGYELENNTVKLNKAEFNLIELTKNIINENKYLLCEKNLTINIKHKNNEYIIYADKLQIERVIINLLSNAIKYSTENSEILIKIGVKNQCTSFLIKNQGSQIQNNNNDLFKKFKKGKTADKNSSGLGLYISKRIIEKHNGRIFVIPTTNSEFICSFQLPLNNKQKNKLLFK